MFGITEEKIFVVSMWWRILYGILRIIFGITLLNVVGLPLADVLRTLMSHELVEGPHDILFAIGSHLLGLLATHPLYISYFIAIYFIFWGTMDVVLSHNLLKHRLWTFPVSFAVIGLFMLYEVIRFTHTHSLILLGVLIIDAGILLLIGREYKKLTHVSLATI